MENTRRLTVDDKGFDGCYAAIPPYMRDNLIRYVTTGVVTGDFLSSVLSNDLQRSVGYADDQNLSLLPVYVRWLYNIAPMGASGSPENLANWRKRGGLIGKPPASGEPISKERMEEVFNAYVSYQYVA